MTLDLLEAVHSRLVWPLADGADKSPLGVLSTTEPLLRLQRTQRVWQVPELDAQHAKAFLEPWPLGVSTPSCFTTSDLPCVNLDQAGDQHNRNWDNPNP